MNTILKHSLVPLVALSFSTICPAADTDNFPMEVAYLATTISETVPTCSEEAQNAWFIAQLSLTDGNVTPPEPPAQCPQREDVASAEGK